MPTESLSLVRDGMKAEHLQLLSECYHRTRVIRDAPRPASWQTWAITEYDEQIKHGPRYGCGQWFGPRPDHQQKRLRRAINDLERGGLLTTWKRYGRRLSNIKLTELGEEIAVSLLRGD